MAENFESPKSHHRAVDLDRTLDGVIYQKRDGIATITLNRPDRGNSLTPPMQHVMRAIWADVRESHDVRVAILTAAGERHFCTGFDMGESDASDSAEVFANRPLADAIHWSPYQNRVWKPVICCVNGLCIGGGHHFVVDSDIVIASRNASFMDTHVNVGMVGAVENVGLATRLPLGAALRMTLVGRDYRMPAERAHQLGLVDEIVATPADLMAAALEMARSMLKNSPQAMALSKQAVWAARERGYSDALEYAWSLLRIHWGHPDFAEGPRAFAAKREPVWDPDPNARQGGDK